MPKKDKKIETMKIEIYGENVNFIDVLKTAKGQRFKESDNKLYTLYEIDNTEKYFSGYISTTKLSDIAPKHNPNNNVYEKLPIDSKNGEGLGYSNVFIYDKTYDILMYEFNINGCYLGAFGRYLNSEFNKTSDNKINVDFSPVLRKEAFERMLNFNIYKSVEMQIATPSRSIEKYYEENDSLIGYINDGKKFEADRVTVKFDIPGKPIKGMPGEKISNFLNNINYLKKNSPEDIVEKLSVIGYYFDPEDNKNKKDSVDLILDRYKKKFTIDQPYVLTNPQTREKSYALLSVYLKCKKDFKELFKEVLAV